ncbi:hypothetical protein VPNG_10342 [Cytospora leucostoma]|uniref:DNA2/NAM7 helicase helicase domain-containing protein n=1 Tax=Cytospora leucostoma TaxID=1230097 RepID=A0A423VDF2_9PEZI|nr:hypothetical protein VPNG_10342 [Cytospora leucostoma]
MRDPVLKPKDIPPKLVERFQKMNSHQRGAYKNLLGNIPDGVCVLPGGPGAGKTFFNLTVAAALLWRDEVVNPGGDSPRASRNQILILLDINKPLTDIANKMHQLCLDMGLERKEADGTEMPGLVIRMFCWSYEMKSVRRGRLNAEREELLQRFSEADASKAKQAVDTLSPLSLYKADYDDSKRVEIHSFSKAFRKAKDSLLPNGDLKGREAPILDQAARMWYEKQKGTRYTDLLKLLDFNGAGSLIYLLEHEIGKVYSEVLQAADVIVTTPVTATKYLGRLTPPFNPALVIFEEAPHARELSTLIAIANFSPAA